MTSSTIFDQFESGVRYYCRQTPNLFVTARGAIVRDADGNEFIDFVAGCGSLNLGHNHPTLKRAIIDYLDRDGIGNALDFHTKAKRDFIDKFVTQILGPRGLDYRLQFTGPTGANCVEASLKLARKYTGRHNVVAFTNGFHGMSMGALAATGSLNARRGLQGTMDGVVRLPYDGYHGAGMEDLERFETMLGDTSGGIDPVAAIIVETVQGEGGLNVASEAWLRKLRQIASKTGALLIVDDVQAGCGRTGSFFSFERAGIVPDAICLSKSISGIGLPMALNLVAPQFDAWTPGEHNGTFRGNNMAFVAAAGAIDIWSDRSFQKGVEDRSAMLGHWLEAAAAKHPTIVQRTKGIGMMAGLQFRDPDIAAAVAEDARRRRLLIEDCGPRGEVIKIFAPLNIELEIFAEGLRRLGEAIEVHCGNEQRAA